MTALLALALVLTTGPVTHVAQDGPAVLVLVPDLDWSNAPRELRTGRYARANLSVRSGRPRGTAADGYLTLGAGARAAAPPDSGLGRLEPDGSGERLADWPRLQRYQRQRHRVARLGSLGQGLRERGQSWVLAGDDIAGAAAAADADGRVPAIFRAEQRGVSDAVGFEADVMIVATSLARLPSVLGDVGPDPSCLFVVSVSTRDKERHLGAFAASVGCGLGARGVRSSSTHQAGLVTISDVGTAFLAATAPPGAPRVTSALRPSGNRSVAALVRKDRRSSVADHARTRFIWLFVAWHAGAAFLALWKPALRRSIAVFLLSVAPATFLIMLIPWWYWGTAGAVLATALVAALLAAAVARLSGGDARAAVGLAAALGALVIGVDALAGGPLEIDAPFGNSPIGGGRYYGVGNIGYALLVSPLLVAGAVALDRWGRRAAPWVAAALAAGVVVDGAPWFGADAGGVVAAAPAFGVLLLGYRRGRLSVRRVAVVVAAGVAAVALFALIDTLRSSDVQTHLTRTLGGPGLSATIAGKAERALRTVTSPIANVIVVAVAVLVAARPLLRDRTALRAGAWALVVVAVAGSALNDSGLQVAAAVSAVGWPAYLALAAEP